MRMPTKEMDAGPGLKCGALCRSVGIKVADEYPEAP
jgi:hypothetical protein